MTDISSQTLHLVAKELTATLNDARTALEAYAERSDQRELLEKCADQLHSAHGVLRLVDVCGAARGGDGARHTLPVEFRQRPEAADRRPGRPDARHGATPDLPRARFVRRPRSGAGAAALAQRFAVRARQSAAVRRHLAAAQPQIGPDRPAAADPG